MRASVSRSGTTGVTDPIVLDEGGHSEVALQVEVTGTVTYTVQQTVDNVFTDASPTWFDHPDTNLQAQTVSRQGNYAQAPFAVRVNMTAGTGTVRLTVQQNRG